MKKIIREFSISFIKALDIFVKKQKTIARLNKLNKDEVNAVITEAFYLLGRHHNKFKKRANLK